MIDINKPIIFLEDMDFGDMDIMSSINILYNGEKVCICRTDSGKEITFDKETGYVLTLGETHWKAENHEYK